MDLVDQPTVSHGVVERRFDVRGDREVVPGILWTPEGATGPRPLVLIGHGGGGDKRMPYVLSLARRLVRHAGYAVAAIDGRGHGDRANASSTAAAGRSAEGIARTFVADGAAAPAAVTPGWVGGLGGGRGVGARGR